VEAQLTTMPDGGNKKVSASELIGITEINIHYGWPGVAYGFTDPGFGTSKTAPWRAGANENTVMEFANDVKIEGNELLAGKYGFHIAVLLEQPNSGTPELPNTRTPKPEQRQKLRLCRPGIKLSAF
jgi:hypothetical protein